MAEETPKVENESKPDNLCVRGCGFYGSVQFQGCCSKCYQNDMTDVDSSSIPRTNMMNHSSRTSLSSQPTTCLRRIDITKTTLDRALKRKSNDDSSTSRDPVAKQPRINRCSWCNKRVGLTGFACRCDGLFCSAHRYSDQHQCSFDYQAQGRLELTQANPEVRCSKIRKL